MPQALAGVLIKVGLSKLAATIVANVVVSVGVTLGTTLIQRLLSGGGGKPSDGKVNVNDPVGSRERRYGIVHTGGQRSFLESRNGTLAQVITLGTGEESDVLEDRLNDKVVTVSGGPSGGTVTDASYHGAVHIWRRSGADDQTAIAELTAKFPEWTSDHRQRGCAHVAIICDPVKQALFSEVYNGQLPQYTQVRKGVKLYDPRLDSTAVIGTDDEGEPIYGSGAVRIDAPHAWPWNDNGALVIADYAAHPDGYGMGYDGVNWAKTAREADVCDQEVTTITAETIRRWRIWASYKLASDERREVLSKMLDAVDGFCWQDADGKFNLMVGRYEEPDVVITSDHILGCQASIGPAASKQASAIKVFYTEAAIGYREQESATIGGDPDGDDPAAAPQGLPIYFAPHHNQAARLGKLAFAELGDRWQGEWVFDLVGLNLLGSRFMRLRQPSLRIDAAFRIDGLRLLLNEEPRRVVATLMEVRPEDWDFDAATEEGTPPQMPSSSGATVSVPAPTGLSLSAVQLAFGETGGVAIAASWSGPTRADLTFEAQYSADGADDWVPMGVDDEARTARSGPVDSGGIYDVRVRSVTLLGRPSDWTESTITPTTDPTPLAAPTILSTSVGAGSTTIAFRMPRAAPLAYARRYRSTSNDFTTAVQIGGDIIGALGERIERTDTGLVPGTTYYHWVRAFDDAGVPSALAGPAAATIFYGPGTNLFSAPENFADSVWVKASDGSGSAAPVVTANAATAPDGTMTADTIAFTRGASGYSVIYQGAVATIGNSYKIGVWLKAPSAGLSVALRLGDTNGPALSLTTSWAYYELSATAPYATTNAGLIIWNIIGSSPTSTTIDAWAGQFRA